MKMKLFSAAAVCLLVAMAAAYTDGCNKIGPNDEIKEMLTNKRTIGLTENFTKKPQL
ncbi:uncharacterized protein LOC116418373 isoform X2 [Nasonia vitripennis]|uniref:Uncharacterized protein n=1 Tax=Nasonia vitripennis TaxID=7425 RepID=A0A7M7QLS0_NASVI|nr:uncharacterized protein LOC116418373 isoform X2 [Nasonia vitripennis]